MEVGGRADGGILSSMEGEETEGLYMACVMRLSRVCMGSR